MCTTKIHPSSSNYQNKHKNRWVSSPKHCSFNNHWYKEINLYDHGKERTKIKQKSEKTKCSIIVNWSSDMGYLFTSTQVNKIRHSKCPTSQRLIVISSFNFRLKFKIFIFLIFSWWIKFKVLIITGGKYSKKSAKLRKVNIINTTHMLEYIAAK